MATILVHGAEGSGTTSVVALLNEYQSKKSNWKVAEWSPSKDSKNAKLCLWVMSRGRLTKDHEEAYSRLATLKLPILMVITRTDVEEDPQQFWNKNESFIKGNYPQVIDGFCVCAASAQTVALIAERFRAIFVQSRRQSGEQLIKRIESLNIL